MSIKTHKGTKKRVRITKKGKVKREQAFHRHLMAGKSGNRKRALRKSVIVGGASAKKILALLKGEGR